MTVESLWPEEGEGVRAIGRGGKVQAEIKVADVGRFFLNDCPKKRGSKAGQWTQVVQQWAMDEMDKGWGEYCPKKNGIAQKDEKKQGGKMDVMVHKGIWSRRGSLGKKW